MATLTLSRSASLALLPPPPMHPMPSPPPPPHPAYDPSNTLPPRTRAILVRQAHKLQRLLGETPHVELAIDLSPSQGGRAAMMAKRRNTLATFTFPLPSPPPVPAPGEQPLPPRLPPPKLTLTHIPRLPSPPPSPSPSSISFSPSSIPTLPPTPASSLYDSDSDAEHAEAEAAERRTHRTRMAKLARWTGETVPPELVLRTRGGRGRHSASAIEEERQSVGVHARARSGPASPGATDACPIHAPYLTPLPSSPPPSSSSSSDPTQAQTQTQKRSAKLSKFFGVPEGSLPPAPLPRSAGGRFDRFPSERGSEETAIEAEGEGQKEERERRDVLGEVVNVRLPRVRSFESALSGPPSPTAAAHKHSSSVATTATTTTHAHTLSRTSTTTHAPDRALSPFSIYSSFPSAPSSAADHHSPSPSPAEPAPTAVQVHLRKREGGGRGREVRGRMTELERGEKEEVMRRLRMLR